MVCFGQLMSFLSPQAAGWHPLPPLQLPAAVLLYSKSQSHIGCHADSPGTRHVLLELCCLLPCKERHTLPPCWSFLLHCLSCWQSRNKTCVSCCIGCHVGHPATRHVLLASFATFAMQKRCQHDYRQPGSKVCLLMLAEAMPCSDAMLLGHLWGWR